MKNSSVQGKDFGTKLGSKKLDQTLQIVPLRSEPHFLGGPMKTKTVLLIAAAYSMSAYAEDLKVGELAYGGTGCPANSARVVLDPLQNTIGLIFDQYAGEAGATKKLDRKSCGLALPVKIPDGYSAALYESSFQGFYSLPEGAQSTFRLEQFFAGEKGRKISTTFTGANDSDFVVSDILADERLVFSECGASTILRVNTSMVVTTNDASDVASFTVDHADISAGLVFHMKLRKCESSIAEIPETVDLTI